MRDPGHPDAPLGQVHLATHQWPVVGEALTAVVAGEHDQRVVQLVQPPECVHQLANALVHVADHGVVGVDVATVQVKQVVLDLLGHGLVLTGFPRPVRGGVVQAEQEGRLLLRHALDIVHRTL